MHGTRAELCDGIERPGRVWQCDEYVDVAVGGFARAGCGYAGECVVGGEEGEEALGDVTVAVRCEALGGKGESVAAHGEEWERGWRRLDGG